MKFLKTFLFTISLTFISFGIVSLKGFCASIALDGISSQSLPTLNTNFDVMSQFMANPDFLAYMGDQAYQDLDTYLYNTTGMDIEDHYYNGIALRQDFTDLVDSTPTIANNIAAKFYGSAVTGQFLLENGWQFLSKSAQSLGNNAKTWFLGKVDSATNTVSDACSNMVVKMTAQGLVNYSSAYSNLISSGNIANLDGLHAVKTDSIYINSYTTTQGNLIQSYLNFDSPRVLFSIPDGDSANRYQVWVFVSESEYNEGYLYGSFERVTLGGAVNNYNSIRLYGSSSLFVMVDNVKYYYCTMGIGGQTITSRFPYGTQIEGVSLLGSSISSSAIAYSYSDNTLSSIRDLLNQLIGYYVDSNTMDRINNVIREIPIDTVTDNEGVVSPEAVVTPEQVAELETLIEEAIALSADYAVLLDNDVTADPEPEPQPIPDYTGTAVPEDFPDTIFSPINDSVGGMFDIVSIFEPLFYIFSFSAGLLGLWFVVPFVILFLILFRLLK